MADSSISQADFWSLSDRHWNDAKHLAMTQAWDGAYYLSGYAVECALKALIIRHLMSSDRFLEKRFSERCYTHNLDNLLQLANLTSEIEADSAAIPDWTLVKDWNENSRYTIGRTETETENHMKASERILEWLRTH